MSHSREAPIVMPGMTFAEIAAAFKVDPLISAQNKLNLSLDRRSHAPLTPAEMRALADNEIKKKSQANATQIETRKL